MSYPAILHPDTNDTYWVEFPDLPGCLTYGRDTIEEAAFYAIDALPVCLYETPAPFPEPSDMDELRAQYSVVRVITADVKLGTTAGGIT